MPCSATAREASFRHRLEQIQTLIARYYTKRKRPWNMQPLNGMSPPNPSSQGPGDPTEEAERVRANQMEDDKKQKRSKSTRSKHMQSHRGWNSAHRTCTRRGSRAERRSKHRTLSQTQNKQRTLKGRMRPSSTWLTEDTLIGTVVASLSHSATLGPFIHFNPCLVPSLGLLPFSLLVYLFALFPFVFQSQCVGSRFTLLYSTFLLFQ